MGAAQLGELGTVRQLLHAGASVFARDETGATALHAAAWGDHLAVVHELLGAGARADARDVDGRLPSDVAASEAIGAVLTEALDACFENWSEKSYDSAQDDRPWH